jgi:hypothetical protein
VRLCRKGILNKTVVALFTDRYKDVWVWQCPKRFPIRVMSFWPRPRLLHLTITHISIRGILTPLSHPCARRTVLVTRTKRYITTSEHLNTPLTTSISRPLLNNSTSSTSSPSNLYLQPDHANPTKRRSHCSKTTQLGPRVDAHTGTRSANSTSHTHPRFSFSRSQYLRRVHSPRPIFPDNHSQ